MGLRLPGLPPAPHRSEGGDERWLITYADMITLLLVLFIILYSMANADVEKFQALAESLRDGFGATAGSTVNTGAEGGSGGSPIFPDGGAAPVELFPEGQTPISIFDFAEVLEGRGQQSAGPESGMGQDQLGADLGDLGLGDQGERNLGDQGDAGLGDQSDAGLGDQGDAGVGDAGQRQNLGDQGDQGMGEQGDRANMGDQGDQGLGDQGERNLGDVDQGDRGQGDQGDRNLGDQGDQGVGDAGQRMHLGDQGDQGLGDQGERNIGDQGDAGLGDISDAGLGDQGSAGLGDEGPSGIADTGDRSGEEDAGALRYKLRGILERAMQGEMEGGGLEDLPFGVNIEYDERGIRITAFPTELWFESGSARLKQTGRDFLDVLIPFLSRLPNRIEIQGHTDSIPINTAVYPSNWELSAGRAGSVIRYLEEQGLKPTQLQAAGYADTMPVDTNQTRDGRANNRRVEILVLREETESWDEWRSNR